MIKLINLSKKFNDINIYEKINYTFKENKLTCFYGPSGSGKTTLLNLIAGFDTNYEGDIVVDERPLNNMSQKELCDYRFNQIGFIFQDYNLLKGYSSLDNILMGMNLNDKLSKEEKIGKGKQLLISLGLEDYIDKDIETLSGGQKQRVAIARALMNDPAIILADEPTGALDEKSKFMIMDILKDISKTKTVIIITHDEEVSSYADEIIEVENMNLVIKKKCESDKTHDTLNPNVSRSKANLKTSFLHQLSYKNFKIHQFKYLMAAFVIALGTSAFISTLSFKNITSQLINDFKESNFSYHIGQVNATENMDKANALLKELENENKIEDVYDQYVLQDLMIKFEDRVVDIAVKAPTLMNEESVAYGDMPRRGQNEIAIPANIANKLVKDIKSLIGKEIEFVYLDKNDTPQTIELKVSGLTNAITQDFVLSHDVERQIYENAKIDESKKMFTTFNIINFEEIVEINKVFETEGVGVFTRAKDVESFEASFTSLLKLFSVVSYFVLVVAIAISTIILIKIMSQRYREIGLLAALGYTNSHIRKILFVESFYFAFSSVVMSVGLLLLLNSAYKLKFGYSLELQMINFLIMGAMSMLLTIGLSSVISQKLIKTEPSKALAMN